MCMTKDQLIEKMAQKLQQWRVEQPEKAFRTAQEFLSKPISLTYEPLPACLFEGNSYSLSEAKQPEINWWK